MSTINTDPQKIDELLARGVSEVINKDDLREQLLSGEQLRIKLGIDPTSAHLHTGRSVPLLKLRDFQELGHKIIFLVGNATGVIGDTSDKDAERPMLTGNDVRRNMADYQSQASKIINMDDPDLFEMVYNADWLDALGYREIGAHADAFSLHEFIQRDNIKKRLDAGKRISLRELLYPLMQGYDSVAVHADVELGGTDQRFNLLAGRVLQEQAGQKPQNILMNNLILGTDGRKMSSSWGNTINLTDDARTIGEKVMSIADTQVHEYFIHCTRIALDEVQGVSELSDPREQKIHLAHALITLYHSTDAADTEKEYLHKKFIEKNIDAQELETLEREDGGENVVDMIVRSGAATSKGDARRKIEQGGVTLDGKKMTAGDMTISEEHSGQILKVGKKFFRRLS